MKNVPRISFVVCVEETAEHAVTTVKSIYTQTYPDIEVLVYYCSPYLNENTLITPLFNFPLRDHIHLTVEKSAEPISRAQAIKLCAEKIHGDYVCFLTENSVFSSEDTISYIADAVQRAPYADAFVLLNNQKNMAQNTDPGYAIVDQLLYNRPSQAIVFKTGDLRSALTHHQGKIYELLPEALLLQMQLQKNNITACTIRGASITQKNTGRRAILWHLVRRDTLEILKSFFADNPAAHDNVDDVERWETYYAKLNYYCALYSVTELENEEEIRTLFLEELDREVEARKRAYEKRIQPRKKAPSAIIRTGKNILIKMYQSGQMLFFTLVLVFNLLLLKNVLCPGTALALCYVLWGVWGIASVLFALVLLRQGIGRLKEFWIWLRS